MYEYSFTRSDNTQPQMVIHCYACLNLNVKSVTPTDLNPAGSCGKFTGYGYVVILFLTPLYYRTYAARGGGPDGCRYVRSSHPSSPPFGPAFFFFAFVILLLQHHRFTRH